MDLGRLETKGGNKPLGSTGLVEQDEWLNIGDSIHKEGSVWPVTPVPFQAQTKDRRVGLGYPD